MSRRLLEALAEVHASLVMKLVLGLIAAAILPVTLLVDIIGGVAKRWRITRALATRVATCPRGHRVEVADGPWQCACGFVFEHHAWVPCPACGAVSAITCPCGLTIRSPLEGLFS